MRRIVKPFNAAFTLIEVMIAVAFIGIAMLALLSCIVPILVRLSAASS